MIDEIIEKFNLRYADAEVIIKDSKQCLGATQTDFRLLGESPKPQICSFRAGNAFL